MAATEPGADSAPGGAGAGPPANAETAIAATLALQLPRVGEPETSMVAGMAAPRQTTGGFPNIWDSSVPGPATQPGPMEPPSWAYDFDPDSGIARATFAGSIVFASGGGPDAGVTAFNGRVGDITLLGSDITEAGGLVNPSPALEGSPTAPTQAAGTSNTSLATTQFVQQAIAGTPKVSSFNGRTGAVSLTLADVTSVGGAPLASPNLTGTPQAPTPSVADNSSALATTAFVNNWAAQNTVLSFNGRRGAVTLNLSDVTSVGGAPINSPSFTGTPAVPTAAPLTATTQAASTAFVMNAITASASGVVSFNGRSGIVTLQTSDIVAAGGAPLDSPVLTGTPEAPTPSAGDASDKIATTQFVETALTNLPAMVQSFNGRTGTVTLQLADVTSVGGAPLASPNLTGTPTAPEPTAGDDSTRIATTSFVATALGSYVTQTSLTGQLAGFLPLSGGTLTGPLNLPAGTLSAPSLTFPGAGGLFVNAGSIGTSGALTVGTNLGVDGTLTVDGASQHNSTLGVTGNISGGGTLALSGQATVGALTSNGNISLASGWVGNVNGIVYSHIGGSNSIGFLYGSPNLFYAVDGVGQGGLQPLASDANLKDNLAPITVDCLSVLTQITLQQYDWKVAEGTAERPHVSCGYTAQELEPLIPEAVVTGPPEMPLGVDLMPLLAYCIGAIQQLNARIEELKSK